MSLLCRELFRVFPCLQAGEPEILRMIGAQQMAPRLAPGCDDSAAWEVLQERWRLGIPECMVPITEGQPPLKNVVFGTSRAQPTYMDENGDRVSKIHCYVLCSLKHIARVSRTIRCVEGQRYLPDSNRSCP